MQDAPIMPPPTFASKSPPSTSSQDTTSSSLGTMSESFPPPAKRWRARNINAPSYPEITAFVSLEKTLFLLCKAVMLEENIQLLECYKLN